MVPGVHRAERNSTQVNRRVGRPVKDPSKGPQRPNRVPLGYDKDSPQGRAELARRIRIGRAKAKLRKLGSRP